MFWRFEGERLEKPDREKICSNLDIVKTSLTTPSPNVFLVKNKEILFKKKKILLFKFKKKSVSKVFESGLTPTPLPLLKKNPSRKKGLILFGFGQL